MRNSKPLRYKIVNFHPTMSKEAEDFYSALCDLNTNHKPQISMLTMLAADYIHAASSIVSLIETHIKQVQGDQLPILYLIDSIVKSPKCAAYIPLFSRNISKIFSTVFYKADEKTRALLFKLRHTWIEVFPAEKLHQLDQLINSLDPHWPVSYVPSIYVNPNFVKAVGKEGIMRDKLLKEKKELLELEKRKVELQLLQTKEVLEKEQKKLESYATNIKSDGASRIPFFSFDDEFLNVTKSPPQKRKLDLALSRDPRLMNKEISSSSSEVTKKARYQLVQIVKHVYDSPKGYTCDVMNEELYQPTVIPTALVEDNFTKADFTQPDPAKEDVHESCPTVDEKIMQSDNNPPISENADALPLIADLSEAVSEEPPSNPKSPPTTVPFPSDSNLESALDEAPPTDIQAAEEEVKEVHQGISINPSEVIDDASLIKETVESIPLTDSEETPQSEKELETGKLEPEEAFEPKSIEASNEENFEVTELDSTPLYSPKEREGTITPVSLSSEYYPSPKSNVSSISVVSEDDSQIKKGKDIDLRPLLAAANTPSSEENILTDLKEENVMFGLFGIKDVDLRKAPLPSPPPPPYISEEFSNDKTWAKLKSTDSDKRYLKYSPRVLKDRDRLGRPSLGTKQESFAKSREKQSEERAKDNYNFIINQAQEQFEDGIISFIQYNKMLNEVVVMSEQEKLKEAKKECYRCDDEDEHSDNSSSGLEYYDNPDEDSYHKSEFHNQYSFDDRGPNFNRHYQRRQYDHQSYDRISRWERGRKHTRRPPLLSKPNNAPSPPSMNVIPWKNPRRFPLSDRIMSEGQRPLPPYPGSHTLVPLADINLLSEANLINDDVISIGQCMRQIRFYGDVGVVMLSWDDPREICFQPGSRFLVIDNLHRFILHFGAPPIEVTIDGITSFVRLGRPTRELFVDDKFYSVVFGGPPVDAIICGKHRSVLLEGPSPVVRYGQVKRTDLCGGTVNLILNGKVTIPVHLDGKSQKFDIEGVPCIIKFVNKLSTVLINGVPVPVTFGGQPVPIMFQGKEHFLRLTILPHGIVPGVINIRGMDIYQPPPGSLSPAPLPTHQVPLVVVASHQPLQVRVPPLPQQPLEYLASILSTGVTGRGSGMSYNTEEVPEASNTSYQTSNDKSINVVSVNELYRKLLNSGLVQTNKTTELPPPKETLFLPEVSLSRPETLKIRPGALISQLYDGIQCSTCGVRFPPELGTKKYSNHLDWHFRQNRKEKQSAKTPHSRNWYYDLSDLIQLQDVDDLEEGIDLNDDGDADELRKDGGDECLDDQPSVPVGDNKNPKCALCEDQFEEFFNDEKEEWHIRNAVIVKEGILHPGCLEEMKRKKEFPSEVSVPEENVPSPEPPPQVEIIDISDSDVVVSTDKSEELQEMIVDNEPTEKVDLTEDDNSENAIETMTEADLSKPKSEQLHESDDDILQIEVIERKIESYDLLDDEDEKPGGEDSKGHTSEPEEILSVPITEVIDDDIEVDFSNLKVKKEKEPQIEIVDTTAPTYIATIDGNIIHEKAAPLVAPGRIKINISSTISKITAGEESPSCTSTSSNDSVCFPDPQDLVNDFDVRHCKQGIVRSELMVQPVVKKGKETSGLCIIM